MPRTDLNEILPSTVVAEATVNWLLLPLSSMDRLPLPVTLAVTLDTFVPRLMPVAAFSVALVPVIRDADKKGILELAQESSDLAKKARDGKLSPAEMQGGCFSISSLGGIGGTHFTPIINAPELAILGVSRSFMKPVWDGKQFGPQLTLPLSLSYDHRVIDGAAAARFNAYLCSLLADFRRIAL